MGEMDTFNFTPGSQNCKMHQLTLTVDKPGY